MRYMLLICGNATAEEVGHAAAAWAKEMTGRGIRVEGSRLRPVSEASTVRVRDGRALVSDGPFAETREQLGGFDIVECADLDEAIEVAAAHPMARYGAVEVRPLFTP